MIFREAKIEDIEQIQIVRHSVKENVLSNPSLVTDADCENFLTARGKGWVCEVEQKVVGFSIVDLLENNIWALFVQPEWSQNGIGKKLHNLMMKWYFSKTEKTVWLGTSPATRAEIFYTKCGWKNLGLLKNGEIKFEMTFENWNTIKKKEMKEPLLLKNTITINAPATKVWEALTNPEQTKKYMFGCETVSDWKVGSTLLWQAEYEGKNMIFVKGNILKIESGKHLSYSVFDPNNTSIKDIPENYLTVTYELTEQNGQSILNVTQGDYNTVADGERRYKESYNNGEGWNPILVRIKELVEA